MTRTKASRKKRARAQREPGAVETEARELYEIGNRAAHRFADSIPESHRPVVWEWCELTAVGRERWFAVAEHVLRLRASVVKSPSLPGAGT